jgi:macrolide transport system ATP-binding/permease protein
MAEQPLLRLIDVSRHFVSGDYVVRALDQVTLTIWPGEFIAIMGQSGSGKSTLMNIIGCLDRTSGGRYEVQGRDVSALDADQLAALRRDTFGFVFQRYNLLNTATAEENVEIPAIYAGIGKSGRMRQARALLEQLGLSDRIDHRPSQLSGGQQQRVAIARALMNDPPIILADEPTGALDSRSGEDVMNLLKELHAAGRTVILITHDEKVAANAQRILRIHDGRLVDGADRSPADAATPSRPASMPGGSGMFAGLGESAKMAVRALRANLFRTALTLLGIVIGVASVITMMAVGSGSKEKVLQRIGAMGTNIVNVRPGAPGIRGGGDIVTLVVEDALAIQQVDNVEYVLPERGSRYTARVGNIDYSTSVQGTWPAMPQVRDWPIEAGGFFTERDLRSYAPVAVLGQTTQSKLFPGGEDPIGRFVLIKNVPFEIVGTLSSKGSSMFGTDQDDSIYIPLSTGLMRVFGKTYLNGITVRVEDVTRIEETEAALTDLLKSRHRTEDFSIRNMASILQTATATQNTLTVLLGAVAAISLLVGGIGVMNIMLVSVTERTREIGIRMATGARMRDILLQFNTEAAVVCTFGGLIGVGLGFGIGLVLRRFGIDVIFDPLPAVIAFGSAFITGLLFGYLPARKAARLDPVVALASE